MIERVRKYQHVYHQTRQQWRDLRAVGQFGQQHSGVRRIVDFACGRIKAGRFAGHHQQIHTFIISCRGPRAKMPVMRWLAVLLMLAASGVLVAPPAAQPVVQEYSVPAGSHPHDVAPARDGGVWFTAQAGGFLGWLDPATGEVRHIPLGDHSAPHGVIVGPDGAPWITDGGQNAIVRVDPSSNAVQVFPLPAGPNANLNTETFDRNGILWFTGQSRVYGRLDPSPGVIRA